MQSSQKEEQVPQPSNDLEENELEEQENKLNLTHQELIPSKPSQTQVPIQYDTIEVRQTDIPPRIDICKSHLKASQFKKLIKDEMQISRCKCCNEIYPSNEKLEKYSVFGFDFENKDSGCNSPAVSCFFIWVKYTIFVYLFMGIVFGLLSFVFYVINSEMGEEPDLIMGHCSITSYLYQRDEEYGMILGASIVIQIVIVIQFFIWVKMLLIIHHFRKKTELGNISPRDFALLLSNIPPEITAPVPSLKPYKGENKDDLNQQLQQLQNQMKELSIELKKDKDLYDQSKDKLNEEIAKIDSLVKEKEKLSKQLLQEMDEPVFSSYSKPTQKEKRFLSDRMETLNQDILKIRQDKILDSLAKNLALLQRKQKTIRQEIINNRKHALNVANPKQKEIIQKRINLSSTTTITNDATPDDKVGNYEMEDILKGEDPASFQTPPSKTAKTEYKSPIESLISEETSPITQRTKEGTYTHLQKQYLNACDNYILVDKFLNAENAKKDSFFAYYENLQTQQDMIEIIFNKESKQKVFDSAVKYEQLYKDEKVLKEKFYEASILKKQLLVDTLKNKIYFFHRKYLETRTHRRKVLIEIEKINLQSNWSETDDPIEKAEIEKKHKTYEGKLLNQRVAEYELFFKNFFEDLMGIGSVKRVIIMRDIQYALAQTQEHIKISKERMILQSYRQHIRHKKDVFLEGKRIKYQKCLDDLNATEKQRQSATKKMISLEKKHDELESWVVTQYPPRFGCIHRKCCRRNAEQLDEIYEANKEELKRIYNDSSSYKEDKGIPFVPLPAAIAIFRTPKIAHIVRTTFNNKKWREVYPETIPEFLKDTITFDKIKLQVNSISNPSYIYYQNLCSKSIEENISIHIIVFVMTIILGIGIFGLCFFLKSLQTDHVKTDFFASNFLIQMAMCVILSLFKEFMYKMDDICSRFPRYECEEKKELTTSIMRSIQSIISSIVVPLTVYNDPDKWRERGDLLDYLMVYFISKLIACALKIVAVDYLYVLYMRWLIERRKPHEQEHTQQEANKFFEAPEFNSTSNYSSVFSQITTGIFFLPIFPMGALFTLITLTTHYWTQKYLLLKRNKTPSYKSGNIASYYLIFSLLISTVVLFCSNQLFSYLVGDCLYLSTWFTFFMFYLFFGFKYYKKWMYEIHQDSMDRKSLTNKLYNLMTIVPEEERYDAEFWEKEYDSLKLEFGMDSYSFKYPLEHIRAEIQLIRDIQAVECDQNYQETLTEQIQVTKEKTLKTVNKTIGIAPKEKHYVLQNKIIRIKVPKNLNPVEEEQIQPLVAEEEAPAPMNEFDQKDVTEQEEVKAPTIKCKFNCNSTEKFTIFGLEEHKLHECVYCTVCKECQKGIYIYQFNMHRITAHPDIYKKCKDCDLALEKSKLRNHIYCYKCMMTRKKHKPMTIRIICPLCLAHLSPNPLVQKDHLRNKCKYNPRADKFKKIVQKPKRSPQIYY